MLIGLAVVFLAVAAALPLWARSKQRSLQPDQPPPVKRPSGGAVEQPRRSAPPPWPDSPTGRFLLLGLWQLKDPVALAWTVALAVAVVVVLVATPGRSAVHTAAIAATAPALASVSTSVALRRRIRGKRWSEEPPPNSRPAEVVRRARERREARRS